MKKIILTILLMTVSITATVMVSCKDQGLGPTIYDTSEKPLDRTVFTFPLDTFVKKNFLEPYNLRYIYKLEDIGSDLQKNLIPADYDKSVKLAVLNKFLWYDVYLKHAGLEFLKLYSPRIILLTGSPSVNPSQHTETLGVAEGGVKIYLYKVNTLNEADVDHMNHYFFHTMHHEFAHILDQTHSRPQAFNLLSNGHYDPQSWGEAHDSLTCGLGFITPYASSAAREDWVEVISSYITNDSLEWNRRLGAAAYEWESIDASDDEIAAVNRAASRGGDRDTLGYVHEVSSSTTKIVRKVIARNADGTAALQNGRPVFLDNDGIDGQALILEKLEMGREWLRTEFNVDLDSLRHEVQTRTFLTNADGSFALRNGRLVNRLTSALPSGNQTLIDSLVDEVNQYKALIIK
jgi:substrate import-associated zinc metallohydrolase lipoprotein